MKSKKVIIPAIIITIFLITTFLSQSKTNLAFQLRGPKAGVSGVFTAGDKLLALSGDNEVYAWDWNDLKTWPTVARLKAEQFCPMASDKIVYIPNNMSDTLIITDLKGEKEIKNISLPFGAKCEMMDPSPDCSFIIILLKQGRKSQFAMIGPTLELTEVYVLDDQMQVFKTGISNDGHFIAAAGEQNGGTGMVIDTHTKEVVFKKHHKDVMRFDNVIFSPDSKTVYFGEKVRFIYAFETATGDLLRTYEMPEYKTGPNEKQYISCITMSPDNKKLLAVTEPASSICFWDTTTGSEISSFSSAGPISSVIFSPDAATVAVGCLVDSTVKIYNAPDTKTLMNNQ
jgi:WD40 repeat protein